ncbi:hypothetical protein P4O66_010238 [Electrophorus voltai]|uniref:Uncharacterized protein n=1 Tax=Electrophorus voltai TaxID=2609070 RepID=A0AAD8Z9E0_9TELE|nr:hypothetical protein P4O66_010238 [Electrophorus voltai]
MPQPEGSIRDKRVSNKSMMEGMHVDGSLAHGKALASAGRQAGSGELHALKECYLSGLLLIDVLLVLTGEVEEVKKRALQQFTPNHPHLSPPPPPPPPPPNPEQSAEKSKENNVDKRWTTSDVLEEAPSAAALKFCLPLPRSLLWQRQPWLNARRKTGPRSSQIKLLRGIQRQQ